MKLKLRHHPRLNPFTQQRADKARCFVQYFNGLFNLIAVIIKKRYKYLWRTQGRVTPLHPTP